MFRIVFIIIFFSILYGNDTIFDDLAYIMVMEKVNKKVVPVDYINIVFSGKDIERHKEIAYKLLKKNLAFKCVCTTEELEKKRLENKKNHLNVKRLCSTCENNSEIKSVTKNVMGYGNMPTEISNV